MQPFRAVSANFPSRTGILLALAAFADEAAGTLAGLFAYVGALALLATLVLYGISQIPAIDAPELAARSSPGCPIGRHAGSGNRECGPAAGADWTSATETPRLRGTL